MNAQAKVQKQEKEKGKIVIPTIVKSTKAGNNSEIDDHQNRKSPRVLSFKTSFHAR